MEPICFGFNCTQVGSSGMLMELFLLQFISPRLQLWPSHFFGLGHGFHLLQSFLQHSKIVALVQSGFEFKKGSYFFAKIGQTNFEKFRKMQGSRFLSSWNFAPLVSSQKFPKHLFYLI